MERNDWEQLRVEAACIEVRAERVVEHEHASRGIGGKRKRAFGELVKLARVRPIDGVGKPCHLI